MHKSTKNVMLALAATCLALGLWPLTSSRISLAEGVKVNISLLFSPAKLWQRPQNDQEPCERHRRAIERDPQLRNLSKRLECERSDRAPLLLRRGESGEIVARP